MPTNIFQKKLRIFLEADEVAGTDGAAVSSFTDLSGNGRHLTAASNKPLIKANAVNSKKSVIWNGTNNPLTYTGTFPICSGFLVAKVDGNFTGDFQGILSTPADHGILTGIGGSNLLYDFQYAFPSGTPSFEYRLNDRIYSKNKVPPENHAAPVSSFGIIFFRFWQDLLVDGIQLGQDRAFSDRKFDGEIALLALYDREFCEREISQMFQSIAFSYQIALVKTFPFQGSKSDVVTSSKRVLTDGQDEPVVRVKRGARKMFDLNFTNRNQKEVLEAEDFWNYHYPGKRFLYRDYELLPPVDTSCTLPVPSEFARTGGLRNSLGYQFAVMEAGGQPLSAIPATAPNIPDETPPSVTLDSEPSFDYDDLEMNISGTVSDNSGFTFVRLYIDGVPFGSESLVEDGVFTLTVSIGDLRTMTGSLYVAARDGAGNTGESNTIDYDARLDTIAPSIPYAHSVSGTSTSEFLIEIVPPTEYVYTDEELLLLI